MASRISRNGLVMCAMAVAALLSAGGGGVAAYHLVAPFSNAVVAKGGLTPSESDNLVRFTGNQSDEGVEPRGLNGAYFVLEVTCDVPLPCPTTQSARCLSYYLDLADYGTRVFAVHSGGITYAAVHGTDFVGAVHLPFLLRRVSSNDELTQVPGAYLLA
ncbi:hypothetical protein GOP47_0005256 [Adiantum capillus-veneris]|uniref:Uncharacterized protein n=1 Tax=Adiantum capillus-veneris TaxID=13818 RepID=A0A9D4ZN26_ADICA|nr:hypothetical protein GOP47_0005256 [Adiantum capillus-veneris]